MQRHHQPHDEPQSKRTRMSSVTEESVGDVEYDENHAPVDLVVHEWAQGTSIHGVAEVADSPKWKLWKRLLWLTLVLISGGLMIWQIDSLIGEYQNYDVTTDTETLVPDWLEFPEITICNMNLFSESLKLQHGIDEPATPDQLRQISVAQSDFFISGTFNDKPVNTSRPDIFKPIITTFGQCWSFQTNETILRPGLFGGLLLYFFLGQDDFSESASYAGVMVFAQQPGTLINDQLPFFTATPGQHAIVRLTKTEFVREREAPWARCHSTAPQYTQPQCRDDCINAVYRSQCNCSNYGDAQAPPNMTYCQPETNAAHKNCTANVIATERDILQSCDCSLPPCHQIQYDAVVNNIDFSQTLFETFEEDFGDGDANNTADDFVNNFVGILINYDKIQNDKLTETKAVTFAQLLGSIGGSMGLFLGISALSIFEVFGDLLTFRLLPRICCGHRHLYGLGARRDAT